MNLDDNNCPQLSDEDLRAITEASIIGIQEVFDKVPREMKDLLMPGYRIYVNIPTKDSVNYCALKISPTEEGIWMLFEVNNSVMYERVFPYSDSYRFPRLQR